MTEPESQPMLTRQLAAECDHVKMENAELRSTVSRLHGLVNEWMVRASATHERLECRGVEINDLREQVKQLKESLRLIQQMRRAEG